MVVVRVVCLCATVGGSRAAEFVAAGVPFGEQLLCSF